MTVDRVDLRSPVVDAQKHREAVLGDLTIHLQAFQLASRICRNEGNIVDARRFSARARQVRKQIAGVPY